MIARPIVCLGCILSATVFAEPKAESLEKVIEAAVENAVEEALENTVEFSVTVNVDVDVVVKSAEEPEKPDEKLMQEAPVETPLKTPAKAPAEMKKALLITAESLTEAWKPFIAWKQERAIEVEMVTVKAIGEEMEGPDIQEKIRQYVQGAIAENGIRWVILGGDSLPGGKGLVPDRDTLHVSMWGRESDIPTDIYYLSSKNWDADGDGVYGEFKEDREAIVYPDGSVGLGRIPVRTAADVAAYTEKVKQYESSYPDGTFKESFLYTCTVSGAYAKVRRSWDDWVSKALKDGEVSRYFANKTPWDKEEDGDYALSGANWVKMFNEAKYGKMHLHGHGFIDGWVMEDGRSLFGHSQVEQLTNKGAYPMITTVSCFTGHYDAKKDPSIAEAMIRKEDAGAIAIVAPCREGKPHFVDPQTDLPLMVREGKLDGTTRTMTLFWSKGLEEQATAGEALMLSKKAQVDDALISPNIHMGICELNLLGDPTLAVGQSAE